jgi:hypothetical protein
MISETANDCLSTRRLPLHVSAAKRHLRWALDLLAAGDVVAATTAFRDLQAVMSEIEVSVTEDQEPL